MAGGAAYWLAGMDTNAHPDRTIGCGSARRSLLQSDPAGDRLPGAVEDHEEAVALGLDLPAAGPGDLRDTAQLLVRSMRRGAVTYAPEMDADEGDDLADADLP